MRTIGFFPPGLKVGDFIQTTSHFADIYFEVVGVIAPTADSDYWHINYATYGKYSGDLGQNWVNSAGSIRAVIAAEMAIPVMIRRHIRFHARCGQYDPIYGFAPRGTPLRRRDQP